jgi:hypothetical protein
MAVLTAAGTGQGGEARMPRVADAVTVQAADEAELSKTLAEHT